MRSIVQLARRSRQLKRSLTPPNARKFPESKIVEQTQNRPCTPIFSASLYVSYDKTHCAC